MMNQGEALSGLTWVASKCEVTNGDQKYVIFDMNNADHCQPAPPVFFAENSSSNPAVSFYSYKGFAFADQTEETSQRVSCIVNVCHEEDSDSVCFSGCYDGR